MKDEHSEEGIPQHARWLCTAETHLGAKRRLRLVVLEFIQNNEEIIGVIIGSLLTAAVTFITTKMNLSFQRSLRNEEHKQEAYRSFLDSAIQIEQALNELAASVSGRQSELTALTRQERIESKERDDAGVAAIHKLTNSKDALAKVESAARLYASEDTRKSLEAYDVALSGMLDELLRQASKGIYTAHEFILYLNALTDARIQVEDAMARDIINKR